MAIQGVIHSKRIELSEAPGLPDGQRVAVQLPPLRSNFITVSDFVGRSHLLTARDRLSEQILDLPVDAAQLRLSPGLQRFVETGLNP